MHSQLKLNTKRSVCLTGFCFHAQSLQRFCSQRTVVTGSPTSSPLPLFLVNPWNGCVWKAQGDSHLGSARNSTPSSSRHAKFTLFTDPSANLSPDAKTGSYHNLESWDLEIAQFVWKRVTTNKVAHRCVLITSALLASRIDLSLSGVKIKHSRMRAVITSSQQLSTLFFFFFPLPTFTMLIRLHCSQ